MDYWILYSIVHFLFIVLKYVYVFLKSIVKIIKYFSSCNRRVTMSEATQTNLISDRIIQYHRIHRIFEDYPP